MRQLPKSCTLPCLAIDALVGALSDSDTGIAKPSTPGSIIQMMGNITAQTRLERSEDCHYHVGRHATIIGDSYSYSASLS